MDRLRFALIAALATGFLLALPGVASATDTFADASRPNNSGDCLTPASACQTINGPDGALARPEGSEPSASTPKVPGERTHLGGAPRQPRRRLLPPTTIREDHRRCIAAGRFAVIPSGTPPPSRSPEATATRSDHRPPGRRRSFESGSDRSLPNTGRRKYPIDLRNDIAVVHDVGDGSRCGCSDSVCTDPTPPDPIGKRELPSSCRGRPDRRAYSWPNGGRISNDATSLAIGMTRSESSALAAPGVEPDRATAHWLLAVAT